MKSIFTKRVLKDIVLAIDLLVSVNDKVSYDWVTTLNYDPHIYKSANSSYQFNVTSAVLRLVLRKVLKSNRYELKLPKIP